MPWTTQVGFFNGKLQKKSDFAWPGTQETWQSADGTNGYGQHDMSGNVWQLSELSVRPQKRDRVEQVQSLEIAVKLRSRTRILETQNFG